MTLAGEWVSAEAATEVAFQVGEQKGFIGLFSVGTFTQKMFRFQCYL